MWWHNWCEKGPLAKIYLDCMSNVMHSVKEYISNGNWNMDMLKKVLPDNIVNHIGNISIGDENHSDYAIWNISAWQSIIEFRQKNLFVWHKNLPLILKKLPFDEVLHKFGKHLVSNCMCCTTPVVCESLQHVFSYSDTAKYIWNTFGNSIGINHRGGDVQRIFSTAGI